MKKRFMYGPPPPRRLHQDHCFWRETRLWGGARDPARFGWRIWASHSSFPISYKSFFIFTFRMNHFPICMFPTFLLSISHFSLFIFHLSPFHLSPFHLSPCHLVIFMLVCIPTFPFWFSLLPAYHFPPCHICAFSIIIFVFVIYHHFYIHAKHLSTNHFQFSHH